MTDSNENHKWEKEQELQKAFKVHDHYSEFVIRTNDAAINNANLTLRTLLLLNGGAAIAMLAFIGQLAANKTEVTQEQFRALAWPLLWFSIGSALAALSNGLAYFTNLFVAKSAAILENFLYEHPFFKPTPKSKKISRRVKWLRGTAVVCAIASIFCFSVGLFATYMSIAIWADLK